MKKSALPAALLLFAGSFMSAQQALWQHAPVTSPEINPDTTVTFRMVAPHAKKVSVTGDFLTAPADMSLNTEGVWEFTTDKLSPELYSYNFIVDDVKINDPSNVYLSRDIASLSNIFIIPGGYVGDYAVNDVPHGSVTRVWYDSPALDMKRRMTIYTPPGYEGGTEKYPVLYLLHGMGGDEEAWISLGRTAQILDNLIASGKAEPMIVVMPNGNA